MNGGAGCQTRALRSEKSGSANIPSRCGCELLQEPPFCSVAAATDNIMLFFHPTGLLVARDGACPPPGFLWTSLGVWAQLLLAGPVVAGKGDAPLSTGPKPHLMDISQDDGWLLGYLPLQRKIPPTHPPDDGPHKILTGEPHVMHFSVSHPVSPRGLLSPHSAMRTTCSRFWLSAEELVIRGSSVTKEIILVCPGLPLWVSSYAIFICHAGLFQTSL